MGISICFLQISRNVKLKQFPEKGAHGLGCFVGKTRSRRDYGPADFGSLQTEASVKLTPLAAFLIFIKKTMWPFWWYLRDSEAVKSYFYWGPSLNSSARVFFSVFFGDSGPGSQFGQVFQRVCVSPVCSTCLNMCKVCTEAVHSVALWTRVTLHVWACVKYVPKQSIP